MYTSKRKSFYKLLTFLMIFTLFCSIFTTIQVSAADRGAWAPNTAYVVGDTVTYNGSTYTCQQSHTSLVGWEPSNVPALWKLGGSAPTQVATPTFSPAGGTYTSAQNVTISCATAGATIRYTTDGSTPTSTSTAYTGPISVTSTKTIKAIAMASGMTNSAVASATYTINTVTQVATPTFSPAGGTYTSAQNVTISCATTGATIRYTTNGSEPTATSTQYTAPISVSATTTIKAKAFKSGMTDSATASATYTISPVTGVTFYQDINYGGASATLQPGSYTMAQMTAAGVPNNWMSSLKVPSGWTVEVYDGDNFTGTKWTYTESSSWVGTTVNDKMTSVKIFSSTPIQTVATPTFSPAGGTYTSAQNVTISCATAGATIRYTTDGSTPTASSTAYTGPISVTSTKTIKAIAMASGMNNSAVASATYTINTTPPPTGSKLLVGYWHNFDNGLTPIMTLRNVSTKWDVINVAFADIAGDGTVSFTPFNATDAAFAADISYLNGLGKKVVLSLGGQNGALSLPDSAAKTRFTNSLIATIDKYGFDGVDIDIETGISLGGGDADFRNPTTPTIVNLIAAMKDITARYGSSFTLSMAPEIAYVQGGITAYAGPWGAYLPIIYGLKDKLTYIHVQHYNCGGNTGLDGRTYNQGTADFEVAMAEMLLKGFPIANNPSNMFPALRQDQVMIGLPAAPGAAPSGGYINPTELKKALNYLIKGISYGGTYQLQNASGYSGFKGLMTWSVNWDAQNNYEFSNNYRTYLDALK